MNTEKLKRRWQKEDEFKISSGLDKALANSEGRKFLWWLLEIGRIGTQPYANNALATAFNCGELNVGQRILDRIISVSPEGYLMMMKENEDECKERDKLLMADQAYEPGAEDGEIAPES